MSATNCTQGLEMRRYIEDGCLCVLGATIPVAGTQSIHFQRCPYYLACTPAEEDLEMVDRHVAGPRCSRNHVKPVAPAVTDRLG
jgi:hypothetical protein